MDYFFGEDSPDEPVYEPWHVAAVLTGSVAALGVLFWLLWALIVCESRVVNGAALVLTGVAVFALRRVFL